MSRWGPLGTPLARFKWRAGPRVPNEETRRWLTGYWGVRWPL